MGTHRIEKKIDNAITSSRSDSAERLHTVYQASVNFYSKAASSIQDNELKALFVRIQKLIIQSKPFDVEQADELPAISEKDYMNALACRYYIMLTTMPQDSPKEVLKGLLLHERDVMNALKNEIGLTSCRHVKNTLADMLAKTQMKFDMLWECYSQQYLK